MRSRLEAGCRHHVSHAVASNPQCLRRHLEDLPLQAILLDFYHLSEHVNDAGRKTLGEKTEAGGQWVQEVLHTARHEGYEPFFQKLLDWRGGLRGGKRKVADHLLNYVAERQEMIAYDICDKHNWDVGTGPMEAAWKKLAVDIGVSDRVEWLGRTPFDELVGLYHAATALWFPSNARSEGYGLVQVEAMACGCPVLNANIPHSGVPWVSRHEETGLTVPVDDVRAFAQDARRMIEELGLRDRHAVEARRQSVERFDHRKMAAESLGVYRSMRALA